ncbi:tetratricopeptide repeat protein [candidate division KSB1 bacterium]
MRISTLLRVSLCLLLVLVFGSPAKAQVPDDEISRARTALRTGDYNEARDLYRDLLTKLTGNDREKAMGYFETFLALGEYQQGLAELEELLEDSPEDPFLLNMKGRFLVETGRYQEAEQAFNMSLRQKNDYWRNRVDLAALFEMTGRKRQARSIYKVVYDQYKAGRFRDTDLLSVAGLAAAGMEEFHDANNAFRTAYQLDPQNVRNLYRWAGLFFGKFNNADAQRTFEEALEVNENWADLYTGYARSLQSFSAMEELAHTALEKNPNHVDAMNILGELYILDSQYAESEAILNKALEVNPSFSRTLANLASVYHFREETEKFTEIEQRAVALNPRNSEFYVILAENCAIRFRYKDAVEFGFQAVARERDNYRAYSTVGTNLLRVGRADEAKRYLDYAFNRDAFDLFAKNTLDLIDDYDNFDVLESEHFSLKIHQSESGILGQLILSLAEDAFDSLRARYPYIPEGKILLEAYNDHTDFAVRISGIPNLDLLGVCFGDIVAFDTPKAREEQEYNWARTLWHELAHVMALGISDHRVPRWFTEGLSVYEEFRARPEWGREMDIELYTALDHDMLLSLEEINRGFTRPKYPGQIMLSYYQSAKMIEFIADTYGFDRIVGLLTEFGSGKSMEESFRTVLNKSPDEINRDFFAVLENNKDDLSQVLTGRSTIFGSQRQTETILEKLFGASASPYFENLKEGAALLSEEKYREAEQKYANALEIYPYYIDIGNPYTALAEIYSQLDETAKRIDILERYLRISEYGAEEARELAAYFTWHRDREKAMYYYERSFQVEPYDINAYTQLAELCMADENYEKEAIQRAVILALNPLDISKAHYNLALSLFRSNRIPEAKMEVLKALEIAPGFREAQKLLLQCIDGTGSESEQEDA